MKGNSFNTLHCCYPFITEEFLFELLITGSNLLLAARGEGLFFIKMSTTRTVGLTLVQVGGLPSFVVEKEMVRRMDNKSVGLKRRCTGKPLILRLPIGSWMGIYF